jgi:excisionase family DNA binding protein
MVIEAAVLKPAEVAARLGVTTGRVYQLIRAGVIPALRIGGALRIPTAAWDEWLEQQRRQAMSSARRVRRNGMRTHASR